MANRTTTAVQNVPNVAIPLTQTILDVFSRDIAFEAQPVMRFEQFAVRKTDLNAAPGLRVRMTTYNNLTPGATLSETTPMSTQNLSTSQREIVVAERGNAVAVTQLLLQASFDDVMTSTARLLGMDYARTTDTMIRDVVLSGTQQLLAGRRAAPTDLVAADVFNSTVVKDAVEVLSTQNAGKFGNDYYVCFIHPRQARTIRDDVEFMNVTVYGKQFAGEIGRIHDVIFIETTQMPVVPVGTPTPFNTFRAVMFGENAYGLATALPVEMRDGGIEDFGRIHRLAWYAIQGAGILEDRSIVRIITR